MNMRFFRILLSAAVVTLLSCAVSYASPRARFRGETILNDPSVRLAPVCKVNDDGTVSCWGRNAEGQLGNGSIGDPSSVPVLVSGITNAVATASGVGFNCALLADGTVKCWGFNGSGQLGIGSSGDPSPVPVLVSGVTNAVAISTGVFHGCALLSTGRVRCWGGDLFGELGNGTFNDEGPATVTVSGIINAVAISAGGFYTCALLADGTAKCWGFNETGELGDGTDTSRASPVDVSGLNNAVAISAGSRHACALLADGTARCWGANTNGQLGSCTAGDIRTPNPVCNLSNAVAIAGGNSHTCALLADGTARCWGLNTDGQLGDGTVGSLQVVSPVAVRGLSNAVAISAGGFHTCAQLANGFAACWGAGASGQLGTGNFSRSAFPVTVSGGGGSFTARDVAAGRDHTCAVRANGTVSCWGRNDSGQLGDGTQLNRLSPVTINGISNAVAVAAGEAHTCALLADGTVRCWGLNSTGQLGDGTQLNRFTPALPVTGLTNAIAIAAGGGLGNSHTCALRADGRVRCWGANGTGQLGNGTVSAVQTSPVTVRGQNLSRPDGTLLNAVSIAVGEFHSCALLADGTAECWGGNNSGQLADSTFTPSSTGHFVDGLGSAVAIAGGNSHNCALLSRGGARCWGGNLLGQLGNNGTTNQPFHTDVLNLSNAVAIAGGFGHTCALHATGRASCWGNNSNGQLGNNTTNPSLIPTEVKARVGNHLFVLISPLSNAVNITTGRRHSCALISNGGVRCWGDNTFGQIGVNSTTTLFTTAVGVPSFTLNIDPTVGLKHNNRVATVTVIATCEAGQRLFFDVNLTQGAASGRGSGTGECTGGLARYEVTVPAQGGEPFFEGAAQVTAEANVRDGGVVVDVQEWTRQVNIINAP